MVRTRSDHLPRRGIAWPARLAGTTLALSMAPAAHAAIEVFACEPEWAALVSELAGDQAKVYRATNALQDPHRIEARPSLIAAARRADLLVCTGAELEAGWLPILLQQAGNPRIQPGRPGHFMAADHVPMREVPAQVDRAHGDVHAAGNPHIQTDPRNIERVAQALVRQLAAVDPQQAAHYQQRGADFLQRWGQATARWTQQAAPLRGTPVVVQHKGFPYLEAWLGLRQVAALEPKPGVEPSSAHLSSVVRQLEASPARMVIRAAYNDGRSAQWLAQRTQLPVVVLPYTVGGNEQATNLFTLFDDTVARLLKALQ
jgi:zinc/manganese transport system substrate-binding protein